MEGNTLIVLVLIIGVVLGIAATAGIAIPYVKKKGISLDDYLSKATGITTQVDQAFDTIKPFLPQGPYVEIIDKILEWAKVGVKEAEQLYHIGELKDEERKQEAKDYIKNILQLAKVEITPEVEKIIDGAIEASVLELGHKKAAEATVQ